MSGVIETKDAEILALKAQVNELRKKCSEVVNSRMAEGTALLVAEHLRHDNDRLVGLLNHTDEY